MKMSREDADLEDARKKVRVAAAVVAVDVVADVDVDVEFYDRGLGEWIAGAMVMDMGMDHEEMLVD